MHHWEKKIPSS
jgi:hypothetical protein